ncbi:unnamed protein product [Macrosiphum euphorbiae]|uniref:Uncharacterized protein n=1 Tax=Macrosiphum euphorbiae TaxID=13131 RepID=A0AAV0W3Y9_9HEMI|nr:unnamed protein product [Macrosiphum euphorbiae]
MASYHVQRSDCYHFSGFTKLHDAVESGVDKTEKNIAILQYNQVDQRSAVTKSDDSVAKINAVVDFLKETAKQIQSNLHVPPTHYISSSNNLADIQFYGNPYQRLSTITKSFRPIVCVYVS